MHETPLSLLERLRVASDEASWHRLFALYTPLIRRWLEQQGMSAADAEDVGQEVWAAIHRDLPRFDHSGRTGAFRLWVRTITLNRLRNHRRSRSNGPGPGPTVGRDRDLDQLEDPDSPLSRLWDREHDEFVARRLMELVEPEFASSTWRSFRRQVLDGLPAAAVAEELGTSVNAVLIAKSRVLRRLRQEGHGLIDGFGDFSATR
jgi:RNA polymerase sigma factor (sigma-70 family)